MRFGYVAAVLVDPDAADGFEEGGVGAAVVQHLFGECMVWGAVFCCPHPDLPPRRMGRNSGICVLVPAALFTYREALKVYQKVYQKGLVRAGRWRFCRGCAD